MRNRTVWGAVALFVFGCGSTGGSGEWTVPGVSHGGIATYYAATGAGACSFDASANPEVAAIDTADYAGSMACGACVEVTGPNGKTTVQIVDECPDCQSSQLDLSEAAFAQIADVSAGRVNVTWQPVPCNVSGNVSYRYKDGTSQYWTAIQVLNYRVPIASLEWDHGGVWQSVDRQTYNYFVVSNGTGAGTVQVRITATTSQKLEDVLPAPSSGGTAQGHAQF
jgi:expansin (peptidoglycan-binding protein)